MSSVPGLLTRVKVLEYVLVQNIRGRECKALELFHYVPNLLRRISTRWIVIHSIPLNRNSLDVKATNFWGIKCGSNYCIISSRSPPKATLAFLNSCLDMKLQAMRKRPHREQKGKEKKKHTHTPHQMR